MFTEGLTKGRRLRVLLVYPAIAPGGGGNGVACWMIEALADAHDVTVLCATRPDRVGADRFFGTSLATKRFSSVWLPAWQRRMLRRTATPLWFFKNNLLVRRARRLSRDFDVVISANNEADLGRPSIQYIHLPVLSPLGRDDVPWYAQNAWVRRGYRGLALAVTGYSVARMRRNLTLTNSDWVGGRVQEAHGIGSTTLFPPAAGRFVDVPWGERELGFVCVGRLSPEKRVEHVIDIVAALRGRGHAARLHIVGNPDHADYTALIRQRVAANADWAELHHDLPREALLALMARHRYGIHGMAAEHFGMAPAELVRAGCVVFVPNDGGQVEIVGDPRLTYANREDAVEKIDRVLRDDALQRSLRAHLRTRAAVLSEGRFKARFRRIVEGFAR